MYYNGVHFLPTNMPKDVFSSTSKSKQTIFQLKYVNIAREIVNERRCGFVNMTWKNVVLHERSFARTKKKTGISFAAKKVTF